MKWLLLVFTAFSFQASAKYRAYKLLIVNEETGTEKEIMSTLDHIQYVDYYHLNPGESIRYLDSWMCWGNTSNFKPICNKQQSRRPPQESIFPAPNEG
jgi:hypothetical protein